MAEETGIGNVLARQLLRTRRPFKTTVLSPDGGRRAGAGGALRRVHMCVCVHTCVCARVHAPPPISVCLAAGTCLP